MATWEGLTRYIKSNYKIQQSEPEFLSLLFDVDGTRSQLVIVRKLLLGDYEWAEISTMVAEVEEVDARDCMERNGRMVAGALTFEGEHVMFRHSLPLAELNASEFEVPLGLVINLGDELEKELSGGLDRF